MSGDGKTFSVARNRGAASQEKHNSKQEAGKHNGNKEDRISESIKKKRVEKEKRRKGLIDLLA
jgi:hypothetical protein